MPRRRARPSTHRGTKSTRHFTLRWLEHCHLAPAQATTNTPESVLHKMLNSTGVNPKTPSASMSLLYFTFLLENLLRLPILQCACLPAVIVLYFSDTPSTPVFSFCISRNPQPSLLPRVLN